MAEWFHLHGGWRLDACAAMLFSRACARRMDAGSSWMVNGGHFHALECHILMEDAQMFALQMVRAGREAELLGAMRDFVEQHEGDFVCPPPVNQVQRGAKIEEAQLRETIKTNQAARKRVRYFNALARNVGLMRFPYR